jgi:predicted ATP-dependent endonuclease of OLD family
MRFIKFEIKNFKGIKHLEIDLDKKPLGNIYTLVGLNESGKTTVLEAISYIISNNPTDFKALFDKTSYSSLDNPSDLVPLDKRGLFTGEISVEAFVQPDADDVKKIIKYAKDTLKIVLQETVLKDLFSIRHVESFENGNITGSTTIWDIKTNAKNMETDAYIPMDGSEDNWQALIKFIKNLIPKVMYFPTFLFEFPKKIYLQDNVLLDLQKEKVNSYYKAILQDILVSFAPDTTLSDMITERLESANNDKIRDAENILSRMSQHISSEIFTLWDNIFNVKSTTKQIEIKYGKEILPKQTKTTWYLEFRIKDGSNIYDIVQRSLGFRWFFCFLLFTHMRKTGDVLFLFDEPASNLHSSAQKQLLHCFSKIVSNKNSKIIYSTHSHYMINPNGLENTYIIENLGLKNTEDDINSFNAKDTDIQAVLYRSFVNENPTKLSYFQPILDLLQYQPSVLENIPDVAMFEGKTDHYFINYFAAANKQNDLHIMPGLGSGKLDALISLYLGWGRKFIIILDGDTAGLKEKNRYREEFLLPDEMLFTLDEIDSSWTCIESLIAKTDKDELSGSTKFDKKVLCRKFQEMLAQEAFSHKFDDLTTSNMNKLILFMKDKLGIGAPAIKRRSSFKKNAPAIK